MQERVMTSFTLYDSIKPSQLMKCNSRHKPGNI